MDLFVVRGDPAFSMLRPVHDCDWQVRGGMPIDEPWHEVEFTEVEDASTNFIAVDCLTMNTVADGFLVSEFALSVLSPLLGEGGEFWPVSVFGLRYWWLNCRAVVEALDRDETDADWSVVEGAWGSFSWITTTRRLAFRPSQLEGAPVLFRVPEYPQGVLFGRDELRMVVETHSLTGFRFDLVWSADQGGAENPPGVGFGDVFEPVSPQEVARRRQLAQEELARRALD